MNIEHYLQLNSFSDSFKKTKERGELEKAIRAAFEKATPVKKQKVKNYDIREAQINNKIYWFLMAESNLAVCEMKSDFEKRGCLDKPTEAAKYDSIVFFINDNNKIVTEEKKKAIKEFLIGEAEEITDEYVLELLLKIKTKISSNVSKLKGFSADFGVNISDEAIRDSSREFSEIVQKNVENFLNTMDYLKGVLSLKKKTAKRPLEFNDGDDKVWFDDGLFLEGQEIGCFCQENEDGVSVYAYDKNIKNTLMAHSAEELKERIQNKKTSLVDLVLEVKNDKVMYAQERMAYYLGVCLEFTKEECLERKYPVPEYPIDINDYDYQLKFWAKRHNVSEIQFLAWAILTGDGFFQYDKKTKRIFDGTVEYMKSTSSEKVKNDDALSNVPGVVLKFGELTEKWQNGVKKLLEAIKAERPEINTKLKNETNDQALDRVITQLEKEVLKFDVKTKALANKKILIG